MRALRIMAFVAAAIGLPSVASGQTAGFICTPDAQVLKVADVNATTAQTTIWYTGGRNESFDDCVVGPDGWLYISSGASILRLSLTTPTASGAAPVISLLGSASRGLAFNVATLYANTATTGIQTLRGTASAAGQLTFPDPATRLFAVGPPDGHGISFDIVGNLVLSSGTSLLRAPVNAAAPFYTTAPSSLVTRTATVYGTAVNACGEIVYADKATRSVRKRSKDGATTTTLATFANAADYPVALEVESNNRTLVVTAQSDTGDNAKLWLIPGSLGNTCPAAGTLTSPLVDLSTLLNGPNQLRGLRSARALGVAVALNDATLTASYSSGTCSRLFDFGFHTVRLSFEDCSVPFTVRVDALESTLAEVSFSTALGTAVEGLRYSPMGGSIVQYVLTRTGGVGGIFRFSEEYGFYAQETIAAPGLARTATDTRTALFTENVTHDFWDAGVFDAAGGGRGPDFSKRVMFNRPLATASTDCRISAADWEQPLNAGNPLFKVGQNVKIAFTAKTSTGAPCGGGGTMRVSVIRFQPAPVATQLVRSVGAAQTENIMDNVGNRYAFNLDTNGYGAGTFQITVWGDRVLPANKTFVIGQ